MVGLVDGNNFFVSCERVVNPALNGCAVAVLSNNDGCCVSRSNEFKALKIPMGTPRFKLRRQEQRGEVTLLSSNFELYGDLSNRVMATLRELAVRVEQYSIDEAFIYPPTTACANLEEYGRIVRAAVLRQVGIPCGVGFAPTKTLAKIANHIAKKRPSGVYVLPADTSELFSALPVDEVWGIGRQLAARLRANRIFTIASLCATPADALRRIGGINLLRTVRELLGEPSLTESDYEAHPDSITYSRSFGEHTRDLEALWESVASFASRASEKLRRHALVAEGCSVFAQYGPTLERTFLSRTVVFPVPTDATNSIVAVLRPAVEALYSPDLTYCKSGIMFFGLSPRCGLQQVSLFDEFTERKAIRERQKATSRLFSAVDALNARFGRDTVSIASVGLGTHKTWRVKSDKLSKRATTRWDELITVK